MKLGRCIQFKKRASPTCLELRIVTEKGIARGCLSRGSMLLTTVVMIHNVTTVQPIGNLFRTEKTGSSPSARENSTNCSSVHPKRLVGNRLRECEVLSVGDIRRRRKSWVGPLAIRVEWTREVK
jgi:hypothetical protein